MLISFEPLLKSCGHLGFSLQLKRCKDNLQQLLGLDNHIYSKKYVAALYRVILHDRIFFFFKLTHFGTCVGSNSIVSQVQKVSS